MIYWPTGWYIKSSKQSYQEKYYIYNNLYLQSLKDVNKLVDNIKLNVNIIIIKMIDIKFTNN